MAKIKDPQLLVDEHIKIWYHYRFYTSETNVISCLLRSKPFIDFLNDIDLWTNTFKSKDEKNGKD